VKVFCWVSIMLLSMNLPVYAGAVMHHDMDILIDPKTHSIGVEDRLSNISDAPLTFRLHENLNPVSLTKGVSFALKKDSAGNISGTYEVVKQAGITSFTIHYKGIINNPIEASDGIYLDGSAHWYPVFNNRFLTFKLDLKHPNEYKIISQGKRTLKADKNGMAHVVWESPNPQEEIYIVGGKLTEYSRISDGIESMVFLRSPDSELANKYIDTSVHYIGMYNKMIGDYPYKKFALVENFWETGYGMPSFTLLGSKVIRFPFIMHSSYPHEILHNWWGNSVFVDYEKGNWCEGLTTYLADYLIKEQHGKGLDYRRNALQRYTDYVTSSKKEFALSEFRSRHNSVTKVIGYDKSMMFFHMLRKKLGYDLFIEGLRSFYKNNKYRHASFADLEKAFSTVSGRDLSGDFRQWVKRSGAPMLSIDGVRYERSDNGYVLRASLNQVQEESAYKLNIPVVVYMKGRKKPYKETVFTGEKKLEFSLNLPALPLRVDIDPYFDVFRRLDRKEIPPALSQAFGADEILIIIPQKISSDTKNRYMKIINQWKNSRFDRVEIKLDSDIKQLPSNRTVWLFGWENRFLNEMSSILKNYDVSFRDDLVEIKGTAFARGNHSIVFAAHFPKNPDAALVWVSVDDVNAIPALGRKLPHYSKYSYLVFEGSEPSILLKGQWPSVNSPLSVQIKK